MTQYVLITGAASGIGKACCDYFKQKSFSVIGVDIVAGLNIFQADLSKRSEIERLSKELTSKNVKLSTMVHSAAVQVEKTLIETTETEWDLVMDVNLKAVWRMAQVLTPLMKRDSSIVNISSVHARATSFKMSAYAASKGALSALTRAMAIEFAQFGIRVNSVNPGAIDTPMLQKGLERSGDALQARRKLEETSPLKQIGKPSDVANLVGFLCDHTLSSNITGQEFYCDSGVMARLPSE